MIIHNDVQLDFDDVLIAPQTTTINHRGEVDVVREYKQLIEKCQKDSITYIKGCPIISSNMTQTGTFEVAEKLLANKCFASLHKFYSASNIIAWMNSHNCEDWHNLFITVGIRDKEKEINKLTAIKVAGGHFSILVDVPNAYIPNVLEYIKELRNLFPDNIIAVGNVCTGDETQKLILAGANLVKVGIGPSQVCDTRIKTGCGRPQLSAIIECANAAHQVGGLIIADGGFKTPGDICKALVAGADICMSGSLFAGCDEASGGIITKCYKTGEYSIAIDSDFVPGRVVSVADKPIYEFKKYKEYYGMSSFRAQKENYGKVTTTGTSEGVECKLIPYTGPIQDTIDDIKGSLRSCGSYIGAKNIKTFSRQGMFYKVNRIK